MSTKYEHKINLINKEYSILLNNQKDILLEIKTTNEDFKSLRDIFSTEFQQVIKNLTLIIESVSNLNTNKSKEKENENEYENINKELEEESPASKKIMYYNDEVFNIRRVGTSTWDMYSLAEPMLINIIYKIKVVKFKDSSNNYAIAVGLSERKLFKFHDPYLDKTYNYLVKNGKKYSEKGKEESISNGGAEEGDIIGVSLLEGEDDNNYNMELFKNGESLGIAYSVPKMNYYFYYGIVDNTIIEISDCYNHDSA